MGYKEDRAWSDKFNVIFQQIIGICFSMVASAYDDTNRNTDIITFFVGKARVACRARRNSYLARFDHQFTIRVLRLSGAKTELDKLLAGWGDFILYGFSNHEETDLEQWILGDLQVLREYIKGLEKLPEAIDNGDGTYFIPFNLRDIPGFVVKSSMDVKKK